MEDIVIDRHMRNRHPEIEDDDVRSAWKNTISVVCRETSEKDFYVSVGVDSKGRLLELVATKDSSGAFHIFHAMTPPSDKTLREVGLMRQQSGDY